MYLLGTQGKKRGGDKWNEYIMNNSLNKKRATFETGKTGAMI
jgi:hypothetical protein